MDISTNVPIKLKMIQTIIHDYYYYMAWGKKKSHFMRKDKSTTNPGIE